MCYTFVQNVYHYSSHLHSLFNVLSSKLSISAASSCVPIVLAIKFIKHIYFLFFFCNTSLFIFSISMLICLFSISFVFNFQFFSSHCLYPFIFFFFLMYLLLTAFSCYSSEDLFCLLEMVKAQMNYYLYICFTKIDFKTSSQ